MKKRPPLKRQSLLLPPWCCHHYTRIWRLKMKKFLPWKLFQTFPATATSLSVPRLIWNVWQARVSTPRRQWPNDPTKFPNTKRPASPWTGKGLSWTSSRTFPMRRCRSTTTRRMWRLTPCWISPSSWPSLPPRGWSASCLWSASRPQHWRRPTGGCLQLCWMSQSLFPMLKCWRVFPVMFLTLSLLLLFVKC